MSGIKWLEYLPVRNILKESESAFCRMNILTMKVRNVCQGIAMRLIVGKRIKDKGTKNPSRGWGNNWEVIWAIKSS